jgi:8-oxo-dGTP pyrophosphatase MutT (NUDIX family)
VTHAAASAPLPPAVDSMTLLVGAVIVHDRARERVLLLQRGPEGKFAPGLWDLPVGKCDPGEAVTDTAVRELREETGLVVAPDDLSVAHIVHGRRGVESPNGFLTVVFATERWSGEPVNREPHKHAELRWWPAGALPEQAVPSMREAVTGYLAGGVEVSTRGWE